MSENSKKNSRKSKIVLRRCDVEDEAEKTAPPVPDPPSSPVPDPKTALSNIISKIDNDKSPQKSNIEVSVSIEVERDDETEKERDDQFTEDLITRRILRKTYTQCKLTEEVVKSETLKIMSETTSLADKLIEIEVRNSWGKFVRPLDEESDDEVIRTIQNIMMRYSVWNGQSKHRGGILAYKCYICKIGFWRLSPFIDHIRTHKSVTVEMQIMPNLNECCLAAFSKIRNVDVKIEDVCYNCLKSWPEHKPIHKVYNYYCSACNASFLSCLLLFEHEGKCAKFAKKLLSEQNILTDFAVCAICEINCLTLERYEQHILYKHTVRSDDPVAHSWPLRSCARCTYKYFHVNVHFCPVKYENYSCSYCKKKFQFRWQLNFHTAMFTEVTSCRICRKWIKQCCVVSHMLKHSTNYITTYKCIKCKEDLYFPDEYSARKHSECCHNLRLTLKAFSAVILPKQLVIEQSEEINIAAEAEKNKCNETTLREADEIEVAKNRDKPKTYKNSKTEQNENKNNKKDENKNKKIKITRENVQQYLLQELLKEEKAFDELENQTTVHENTTLDHDNPAVNFAPKMLDHDYIQSLRDTEVTKIKQEPSDDHDIELNQEGIEIQNPTENNVVKKNEPLDDEMTINDFELTQERNKDDNSTKINIKSEPMDDEMEMNEMNIKELQAAILEASNTEIEASDILQASTSIKIEAPDVFKDSNFQAPILEASSTEIGASDVLQASTSVKTEAPDALQDSNFEAETHQALSTEIEDSDLLKETSSVKLEAPEEIQDSNFQVETIQASSTEIEASDILEASTSVKLEDTDEVQDTNDVIPSSSVKIEPSDTNETFNSEVQVKNEKSDSSNSEIKVKDEPFDEIDDEDDIIVLNNDNFTIEENPMIPSEDFEDMTKFEPVVRILKREHEDGGDITVVSSKKKKTGPNYIRKKNRNKRFTCHKCGFTGKFKRFNKHKSTCRQFRKITNSKENELTNKCVWEEFCCTKCDLTFFSIKQYITHFSSHYERKRKCPLCKFVDDDPSLTKLCLHFLDHLKESFKETEDNKEFIDTILKNQRKIEEIHKEILNNQSVIEDNDELMIENESLLKKCDKLSRINENLFFTDVERVVQCIKCDRKVTVKSAFKHFESHVILETHKMKIKVKEEIDEDSETSSSRLSPDLLTTVFPYRMDFKKWSSRGEDKEKMKERKKQIQQAFKAETGLLVDVVEQGAGSSNDGNTARRFFSDARTSARITGVDEELIERFHIILQAVASGEQVDLPKFSQFCRDTATLYVRLYPWYYMPSSVHKLLVHGADIIKHFGLLPIGKLSEEASEARNKDFRKLGLCVLGHCADRSKLVQSLKCTSSVF